MKSKILLQVVIGLILATLSMLASKSDQSAAGSSQSRPVDPTFEHYRTAIKDSFQIDIKDFCEKLNGGMADGKAITHYELGQLLEGIKWEREHAADGFIALEIAMDHLERIPDYYTRLLELERDAMSDRLLRM
jgi:hypothetical protein